MINHQSTNLNLNKHTENQEANIGYVVGGGLREKPASALNGAIARCSGGCIHRI
jgi:hypothetical protein